MTKMLTILLAIGLLVLGVYYMSRHMGQRSQPAMVETQVDVSQEPVSEVAEAAVEQEAAQ